MSNPLKRRKLHRAALAASQSKDAPAAAPVAPAPVVADPVEAPAEEPTVKSAGRMGFRRKKAVAPEGE